MRKFYSMLAVDMLMLALACMACAVISNCIDSIQVATVMAFAAGAMIFCVNQHAQHCFSEPDDDKLQKLAWGYLHACCRHCDIESDTYSCLCQKPGTMCDWKVCHLAQNMIKEWKSEHV